MNELKSFYQLERKVFFLKFDELLRKLNHHHDGSLIFSVFQPSKRSLKRLRLTTERRNTKLDPISSKQLHKSPETMYMQPMAVRSLMYLASDSSLKCRSAEEFRLLSKLIPFILEALSSRKEARDGTNDHRKKDESLVVKHA